MCISILGGGDATSLYKEKLLMGLFAIVKHHLHVWELGTRINGASVRQKEGKCIRFPFDWIKRSVYKSIACKLH